MPDEFRDYLVERINDSRHLRLSATAKIYQMVLDEYDRINRENPCSCHPFVAEKLVAKAKNIEK